MPDLSSISAALTALKTASELITVAVKARDQATIQAKVIELQNIILAAQSAALSAKSDVFDSIEETRQLQARIEAFEDWKATAARYALSQVGPDAFAYSLKAEVAGDEPPHLCCANCFGHRRRSILQYRDHNVKLNTLACAACEAVIKVPRPEQPYEPLRPYVSYSGPDGWMA